jgi:type IV pilus assembly protein PilM
LDVKKDLKKAFQALLLSGKNLAGVDIGLSAVKIAQLDGKDGDFTLTKYVQVNLPEGAIIEDEIQKPEDITAAVVEAANALDLSPLVACLGISGPNTVARKLQLAGGTPEEIEDQVLWEAEQYLPFDIEESTVDYHLVGENEGGGVDVIVAAAKKDVILNFREIVEEAGGVVKIVDLGILAVSNVFEQVMGDKLDDPEPSYLILDMGAQTTYFIIYKAGMIVFTKEINVGGVMITEEIQRQMGVNYYEAEDLKITGDENGNLPEEILEIVDDIVETFFSEIKKAIDFYISSTSDESLQACYVTGGSALIPGILEGLEALLGVDVSVLNPFDVIGYKEKNFTEAEINQIAYQGVQAIGLAMRKT